MQVLVIGAGVIGLAVARTAALAGHDVTVAEITGGIAGTFQVGLQGYRADASIAATLVLIGSWSLRVDQYRPINV